MKGGVSGAFEHADDGLLPLLLKMEGEEGEGKAHPLVGAVEDLPVAEIAPAAERDRARPDSSERKSDFPERLPLEDAGTAEPVELLGRIGAFRLGLGRGQIRGDEKRGQGECKSG